MEGEVLTELENEHFVAQACGAEPIYNIILWLLNNISGCSSHVYNYN